MITVNQMRKLNESIGHNFFDLGTMKWWGSEIYDCKNNFGLFVTGENNYSGDIKLYTVRIFNLKTKEVESLNFQEFKDFKSANNFINKIIYNLETQCGNREKNILQNFSHMCVSGFINKVISIYDKDNNYFKINPYNFTSFVVG